MYRHTRVHAHQIDDPNVLRMASVTLRIASCYMVFDGLQCVMSGVLRGVGMQNVTARINLLAFYAIGLPLSYYLGVYKGGLRLGVVGIWGAMSSACLMQGIMFSSRIASLNWALIAAEASKQAANERGNEGSGSTDLGMVALGR